MNELQKNLLAFQEEQNFLESLTLPQLIKLANLLDNGLSSKRVMLQAFNEQDRLEYQ